LYTYKQSLGPRVFMFRRGARQEVEPNREARGYAVGIKGVLTRYGEALARALGSIQFSLGNLSVRNIRLAIASLRLRAAAKRLLRAIENYDNYFLKALQNFRKRRGDYFKLLRPYLQSDLADPASSELVKKVLGYPFKVSLKEFVGDLAKVQEGREPSSKQGALKYLIEEYESASNTVRKLEIANGRILIGSVQICPKDLILCNTLDVVLLGLDLAYELMIADLPLQEKRYIINIVFPEIKGIIDSAMKNAGLNYEKAWGGLLSLAKRLAMYQRSLRPENDAQIVYELLLEATLGASSERASVSAATEGAIAETEQCPLRNGAEPKHQPVRRPKDRPDRNGSERYPRKHSPNRRFPEEPRR